MNMSNKTYDILKWIAMYLLPAAGTLYFALAGICASLFTTNQAKTIII